MAGVLGSRWSEVRNQLQISFKSTVDHCYALLNLNNLRRARKGCQSGEKTPRQSLRRKLKTKSGTFAHSRMPERETALLVCPLGGVSMVQLWCALRSLLSALVPDNDCTA